MVSAADGVRADTVDMLLAINEIIFRPLTSVNVPSLLEPLVFLGVMVNALTELLLHLGLQENLWCGMLHVPTFLLGPTGVWLSLRLEKLQPKLRSTRNRNILI